MKAYLTKKMRFVLLISGFLIFPTARGLSSVIVFDRVTTVGTPVYLKVLTKGRIFADGGRLVEFYLDDKRFGKNLTGGDGYGYRKYIPRRAGMIKVRATSQGESDSGLLLVMKKSEKAVLIEIESGLKDAFISDIAAGAGRQAVGQLLQKYRVIYLSRYSGIRIARISLDEMEFPEAPVLRWQGEQTLKALKEKGVNLYAIIGPAGVISAAAGYIENRYTFDEGQKEQAVNDWQELMKLLLKTAPQSSDEKKNINGPGKDINGGKNTEAAPLISAMLPQLSPNTIFCPDICVWFRQRPQRKPHRHLPGQ
jgi:hypothetical protein